MSRPTSSAIGLLWVLALAGCDDALAATSLRVSVHSQLNGELRYLHVMLLAAQADGIADESWFEILPGCAASLDLGSFVVIKHAQTTARMRIVGFGPPIDGLSRPVIEKRVDASFQNGRSLYIDVQLTRACLGKTKLCAADQTCVDDGTCGPIAPASPSLPDAGASSSGCMSPLPGAPPHALETAADLDAGTVPPPVSSDPDAMMPAWMGRCSGSDGSCNCVLSGNETCRQPEGERCEASSNCENSRCVHGYCCSSLCGDPCMRCDLPGKEGLCSPLELTNSDDALNCGGCGARCDSTHIKALHCSAGTCDGFCESGFADCDYDKRTNGCETSLYEPTHCGRCDRVCNYDFCDGKSCAWTLGGAIDEQGSVELSSGEARGTVIALNGEDQTIRALGAIVDPRLAGQRMRLALYTENDLGYPETLEVASDSFLIADSSSSEVILTTSAWRAETKVRATALKSEKVYWIFIQVSGATSIHAPATSLASWVVVPMAFADFTNPLSATTFTEFPSIDLYAITTPR